jgi:hypothetical protein
MPLTRGFKSLIGVFGENFVHQDLHRRRCPKWGPRRWPGSS